MAAARGNVIELRRQHSPLRKAIGAALREAVLAHDRDTYRALAEIAVQLDHAQASRSARRAGR